MGGAEQELEPGNWGWDRRHKVPSWRLTEYWSFPVSQWPLWKTGSQERLAVELVLPLLATAGTPTPLL